MSKAKTPEVLVGGCPIVRPRPLSNMGDALALVSDIHLGANNVDLATLKEELERARLDHARILIGGDLFDFILPSDKRYTPDILAKRLQGRRDILNEAVDWACELLEPYADNIDLIGVGNHETFMERRHYFDGVKAVIDRLNTKRRSGLVSIAQAGYTAFVIYSFEDTVVVAGDKFESTSFTTSSVKGSEYRIWFHHGSGRGVSTVKSLSTLLAKAAPFVADLYWCGHSHARVNASEIRLEPTRRGVKVVEIKYVITGSYLMSYGNQTQEDMRMRGRISPYTSEGGYPPHGIGGATVFLGHLNQGRPDYVRVLQ
jgi:hypothetical protein